VGTRLQFSRKTMGLVNEQGATVAKPAGTMLRTRMRCASGYADTRANPLALAVKQLVAEICDRAPEAVRQLDSR
jgi:hypothetical protein